jgi:hypothetical protein
MELRKLKSLLAALNCGPVATYEDLPDGGVKLSFADAPVQFATAPQPEDDGDLELPAGLIDPRKALRDIYTKSKKARA